MKATTKPRSKATSSKQRKAAPTTGKTKAAPAAARSGSAHDARPRVVAYLRVSTAKQGQSGLGLEGQQAAIDAYAQQQGARVLHIFTETESGKLNERPELAKALHMAKVTGATLVIAKLDRLSRNAAFLLALRESGARVVAADMPEADTVHFGVMAVIAQHEREAISKRTKAALDAAKARGVKLGNPNGAEALRRAGKGNAASVGVIKAKAAERAGDLRPVLDGLRGEGITSLGAIAAALNERGMKTPRGGTWHKSSVRNLIDRVQSL
jgi:DNA invertase Pin-like site-specific DNA recombinase